MAPTQMGLLLLGALGLVEGALLIRNRPVGSLWVFGAIHVIATFTNPLLVSISGFRVTMTDAAAAVFLLATVLRLPFRMHRYVFWIVLVSLVAILRGLGIFDTQTVVNSARQWAGFLVALTFVASLGLPAWYTIRRIWTLSAVFLAVVALLFIARNGLATYAHGGDRALNGGQALIVAQGAVLLVTEASTRSRRLGYVLLVVVLASAQRTVWLGTLAMLIGLAASTGHLSLSKATLRRGLAAGAVALGLLIAAGPQSLRQSISTATATASTSSGTLGWRIEGWRELLRRYRDFDFVSLSLGQPFGRGYTRTFGQRVEQSSPHNMYVTVLLSLGIVGLAAFVGLLVAAARRRRESSGVPYLALVVGLAAFGLGYQLQPGQGLLLGSMLPKSRHSQRSSVPGSTRVITTNPR